MREAEYRRKFPDADDEAAAEVAAAATVALARPDLIQRLRHAADESGRYANANRCLIEAADALEALQAAERELAKLREANSAYRDGLAALDADNARMREALQIIAKLEEGGMVSILARAALV